MHTVFHNRQAVQLENGEVRVSLTVEGGHIAEILDKKTGVSPLWIPPWPSIEPRVYSPRDHPEYGANGESRLLAGIMGHNLCLDLFGPPSEDEQTAGLCAHGEAGILPWAFSPRDGGIMGRCILPAAQLSIERLVLLEGRRVRIAETVENLSILDRPIAWTQHVTFGPPFLEPGRTQFRAPVARTIPLEGSTASSGYTANLLDPASPRGWFCAWSPESRIVAGYVWKRADFPWLGIWHEDRSRTHTPWNGRTLARGMEFGVSPFPETRENMIDRRSLLDTPCYLWLRARRRVTVEYYAGIAHAENMPETLSALEELFLSRSLSQ